ncbi:unnamed protein product [Ambrosiozyma monospora]|uniref:Unnamed protein product n=1 Tax=Ambrosiozyma monospora TaxID=43982 RepID=A0A9W7DEX4_AMBMO|nr:unnamed protein product [Ambrosiozyma monospora]
MIHHILARANTTEIIKLRLSSTIFKATVMTSANHTYTPRYYDIGVNLTDDMFEGQYRSSKHHQNDVEFMLRRARSFNVTHMLLTGSSLSESKRTLELVEYYNDLNRKSITPNEFSDDNSNGNDHHIKQLPFPILKCTVGVHPCTVLEFESKSNGKSDGLNSCTGASCSSPSTSLNKPTEDQDQDHRADNEDVNPVSNDQKSYSTSTTIAEDHLAALGKLIKEHPEEVRAFGEIGLDYDRLHYTPKDKQMKYFELQLKLACQFKLPLFLHMRAAFEDFMSILLPFIKGTRDDGLKLQNKKCVVHSFTGTKEELSKLMSYDWCYVSFNGCSFKDEENLEVVKGVNIDKLMIETDSPWCEIKPTSAAWTLVNKSPNSFYPQEYVFNQDVETQQQQSQQVPTTGGTSEEGNSNKSRPKKPKQKPPKKDQITLHPHLAIPVVKSKKYDQFVSENVSKPWFGNGPLIKGRNEPCMVGFVGEVVAHLTKSDEKEVIEKCFANSIEVFGE